MYVNIIRNMSTLVEEEVLTETVTTTIEEYDLIVFNDDVNTFQHVIVSLMDVCGHEPMQATQCAHIVHNTGKCAVKRGTFDRLEPMCTALLERGLSADIE